MTPKTSRSRDSKDEQVAMGRTLREEAHVCAEREMAKAAQSRWKAAGMTAFTSVMAAENAGDRSEARGNTCARARGRGG